MAKKKRNNDNSLAAILAGVIGIFLLKTMIDNDRSQVVTEEGAEYLSRLKKASDLETNEPNIGDVTFEKSINF